MDENRDGRSIANRVREHIGWWLAAGAAIAGIAALLISVTWPGEWRDSANSKCDKWYLKYSLALTDVDITLTELRDKIKAWEKDGTPYSDADYQKVGRAQLVAADRLSEMLGDIRDLDRPWWGSLDGQVETAVDRGSALSRAYAQAGQSYAKQKANEAWSQETEDEIGERLGKVEERLEAWFESLDALKLEQCSSSPPG
ncbi:hypothetical protein ABTX80_04460 [Streptomyces erythrochromogenes]|uniref:hypothetical protein n=1 Tax=Streptomyces erythrochromogenes TaxID=285574 RepID=UPI00332E4BD1